MVFSWHRVACVYFLNNKKALKLNNSRAFLVLCVVSLGNLFGTEGRNRTGTESPPQDFESSASTSSATPAKSVNYSNYLENY